MVALTYKFNKGQPRLYRFLDFMGLTKAPAKWTSNPKQLGSLRMSFGHKFYIEIDTIFKALKRLFYIIEIFSIHKHSFLCIDFEGRNNLFMLKLFTEMLAYFPIHFIYDWGYGIISNFRQMFLRTHSYRSRSLPTMAFLLFAAGRDKIVSVELRQKGIVTSGLVTVEGVSLVDYPFYAEPGANSSILFFKLILHKLTKDTVSLAENAKKGALAGISELHARVIWSIFLIIHTYKKKHQLERLLRLYSHDRRCWVWEDISLFKSIYGGDKLDWLPNWLGPLKTSEINGDK